jgi:hypothetical protein
VLRVTSVVRYFSKHAMFDEGYGMRTCDYAFDDSFAMEVWRLVANANIP